MLRARLQLAPRHNLTPERLNPIWNPSGRDLTVGRLAWGAPGAPALQMAAAGVGAERSLAARRAGSTSLASWSADGSYLAVRFFEGGFRHQPRTELVVVVGGSKRQTVAATSDIEVLGWRDGGG